MNANSAVAIAKPQKISGLMQAARERIKAETSAAMRKTTRILRAFWFTENHLITLENVIKQARGAFALFPEIFLPDMFL
jgi:hypothetical protein